jgi:putative phosphoribosyl transferase
MARSSIHADLEQVVRIKTSAGSIEGTLALPHDAQGVVLFAHGSGSSRHSPRNRRVAEYLQGRNQGTLLIDLLTQREEEIDEQTAQLRFDSGLLTSRLVMVTEWLAGESETRDLPVGYFGASTGGGAALAAAAERPEIAAVVSRGGRPDLAGAALRTVRAPTLLIVGGLDHAVIQLNKAALRLLEQVSERELEIIPGATHLFEEPGALDEVARLSGDWFARHFTDHSTANRPR